MKSPGDYLVTNDRLNGDDLLNVLDFVEQYSFGCWDELPKTTLNRSPSGKLILLWLTFILFCTTLSYNVK